MVSIGPLNPVSGAVSPGEAKVTGVTGWGMLPDGLLSPFLTYSAHKKLCAREAEKKSVGVKYRCCQPSPAKRRHTHRLIIHHLGYLTKMVSVSLGLINRKCLCIQDQKLKLL